MIRAARRLTWITRSGHRAGIEILSWTKPMKPHCPNCLKEMTKASASRNLFNCEPCREIIQYFGGSTDHGEAGPDFTWPIRRRRSVHTAHAA